MATAQDFWKEMETLPRFAVAREAHKPGDVAGGDGVFLDKGLPRTGRYERHGADDIHGRLDEGLCEFHIHAGCLLP